MKPHPLLLLFISFFASLRNIPGKLVLVLSNRKQRMKIVLAIKKPSPCVSDFSLAA